MNTLPKIDLHCHLDGSLSTEFISECLGRNVGTNELTAPYNCQSLAEYLTRFDLPVSCLQTSEHITSAVTDLIRQAKDDNVRYIEIRFAPTLSLNDNLSYTEIYEAAIEGCKKGLKLYGVYSNIIACAMRNHSEEQNLDMLKSSLIYLGNGLCAMDLAGDESGYPNGLFTYLFNAMNKYNIPYTIHSGECGNADNIRIAVDAGAKRIGHGIALTKDQRLMDICKNKHIGFELCPTSNYQTKAVNEGEVYPLNNFIEYGLLATINTDNRTVSGTTMTKEYEFVSEKFNIAKETLMQLYANSIEASFANDDIKNELYKLYEK
ncbi:MAG: adenosine deaminase [Lachnospiraceae bacterium]|nr:adenosine deaminase [Lachnospiraceae bacterium]MBR1817204.1 adenosine deaminase [Lachnospiraceae bacterium]